MTIYDSAVSLMNQIQDETSGLRHGTLPSINVLLALQGELVQLYHQLGEDQAGKFSAKERSYLQRKVEAARHHQKGRIEFSMTQKDAEQNAVLAVKKEYEDEIKAMGEYEHQRLLRDSLGRAFDHLQQVISTLKWMETRPAQ